MPPLLMTALFSMLLNMLAPNPGIGLLHGAHAERTAVVVAERGLR
jgi:hypothetical protein